MVFQVPKLMIYYQYLKNNLYRFIVIISNLNQNRFKMVIIKFLHYKDSNRLLN